MSDWVDGWNIEGKGRVHRLFDPQQVKAPIVRETRAFLEAGMGGRPIEELAALLAHADQRVRNEAHLELAARGRAGVELMAKVGAAYDGDFSQLHALFGLAVAARLTPELADVCLPAIVEASSDSDARIRAQAARALGEVPGRPAGAIERVRALVDDADPRVRLEAGIAAGKLQDTQAVPALVALIEDAEDDAYLRHAGVQGLLGCTDEAGLVELARPSSPLAVRLAAVVALRRLRSAALAELVADAQPLVAHEAARAIHDVPIEGALPALAARIVEPGLDAVVLGRRVLNANYRLGGREHAQALAAFAGRVDEDSALRTEALRMLAAWEHPSGRDRVVGAWRPLPDRDALPSSLGAELAPEVAGWEDEQVVRAWVAWAGKRRGAQAPGTAEVLERLWSDAGRGPELRVEAYSALAAARPKGSLRLVDRGLADDAGEVRAAALELLERMDPGQVLERIPAVLTRGDYGERRVAYRMLGRLADPGADARIADELRRLAAGFVPAELALDLVEAATGRTDARVVDALAALRAPRAVDPELAPYLEVQFGGDGANGKRVFERVDLSCTRCHGRGAEQQIGPDLAGVGKRLTRLQLLESIVVPNRNIARGYQGTVFFLAGGEVVEGLVLEDGDSVRLVTAEGELVELDAARVEARQDGLSAMPEGLTASMTSAELRDLIEYLNDL